MKTLILTLRVIFFLTAYIFLCSSHTYAQSFPPGLAAKFGIDADLKSDKNHKGNFNPSGSHDWFKETGGTGIGLFDTTGNYFYGTKIKAGQNLNFSKKMQYSRYTVQDGILLMDASYARDYFGIGSNDLSDKTVFVSGGQVSNKNWQDPVTWTTIPNGAQIPNKTDIIDTYVSMRRNGTTLSRNNPSDLILTLGATTVSTDGDHYIDFELYKDRIEYNPVTSKFSNSGPAATGGHSAWEFNPDGSIKTFGDLTISYSFNSSTVSNIMILIWVDYNTYKNTTPSRFSFVDGGWFGGEPKSGFGYAQILPNGNYTMQAWGTVNTSEIEGPIWGTNSKDLGTTGQNYYAAEYSSGQFAETAINLTSVGIDPISYSDMNPCDPPFRRFMVKTRSSSSFSSSLQDFTGPYEFLDAPQIPAVINPPANLTCTNSQVDLIAGGYLKGAHYSWSTSNGNIVSTNSDSSILKINKPGTYFLTTAISKGCTENTTSVVVTEDKVKPLAEASASNGGFLIPQSFVVLYGINKTTGPSSGSTYKWKGIGFNYSSSQQNPIVLQTGAYELTVTEIRNGCSDIAITTVSALVVLPVKFIEFTINSDQEKTNLLNWKVADAKDIHSFHVEKSINGIDYKLSGNVFAKENIESYSLKDESSQGKVYYRIKAVDKNGNHSYSSVIKMDNAPKKSSLSGYTDENNHIIINYSSPDNKVIKITLLNMNGQLITTVTKTVATGNSVLKLTDFGNPVAGIYLLVVESDTNKQTLKIKL